MQIKPLKKLRVVHVIPSLSKGGAERLCLDMVRSLDRLPEVEVALVTMRNIHDYAEEYPDIRPVTVNSKVVPSILGKWQVDLEEWNAFLHDFRPDVIHSHLFEAEMMTRFNIQYGVRYFTHCHDNMPQFKKLQWNETASRKRITESYERAFMIRQYARCGNNFIAISADTEQFFKNNLPENLAKKIQLLPNAIDFLRFSADAACQPQAGTKIKLINIGSFVQKKNQGFLLDVLDILRRDGLDATLTLAGDGPLRAALIQRSLEMGLAEHVHFPGNVNHIEQLLWTSHIYVHSATYEPFGLVLLEAMAAGLPVVALDGKGNRGLIENGANGFLISEADAPIFAEHVAQVASVPTWKQMSSCAKALASKYDIQNYVNRLFHLYSSIGH
ncbi:MAG: glycosyltransferase [Flavobacteriales bacterium]|nr:glycosyltransferase [Flavobacteriales bacterium]